MEKSTQAILGGLFAIIIIGIVVLTALKADTTAYLTFLGTILVPSLIAIFGRDEARKGRKASEKAVHNTNGRMSELIQTMQAGGLPIPPGYEDVMTDEQRSVTTVTK